MGEPAVLISMHDLTGIETMKKALAETQLLFYNAFHTGPLGIAVVRLSDGVLLDVNPAYCRLSRTKRDELIGRPLTESGIVLKGDRKSTRLNSSHVASSYAVFCLKKKK